VTHTNDKVVLITGAAKRIGAVIARLFHSADYCVLLHYNHSAGTASKLCRELNQLRDNSCLMVQADLSETAGVEKIAKLIGDMGRIDVLVNNASSFYPTPIQTCNQQHWDDLIGSNLRGPFFLTKALSPLLRKSKGSVVNISDMHARQALKQHPIYSIAKGGNIAMTKAMALELAPDIRVNSVAPGAILWPEGEQQEKQQQDSDKHQAILNNIPMGKLGTEMDIAQTVWFLAEQATYVTGQTIAVDGGRSNSL
jgi:pteridine reductase